MLVRDRRQHRPAETLDVYRIPRDQSADRSTPAERTTVGLDDNPYPPVILGPQRTSERRFVTASGRPGRFRSAPVVVGARDLDAAEPVAISPGTIRRNVKRSGNGAGIATFNPVTNRFDEPGAADFSQLQAPQDEYVMMTLALGLQDPLPTVVSGFVKPQPGLTRTYHLTTIQAQPSTGWPVLAPQIPSYGSRIPLRRPRGLVAVNDS